MLGGLLVFGLLLAGFLAYVASRPGSFRIERSIVVQASAGRVFALVNDFGQWKTWSPWENKDPAMQRSFSGPAAGVGAAYGWEGNKNVGTGRMEITESSAPSSIRIQLDFLKPFEAHNQAVFSFVPEGDGAATRVLWAMEGPAPFMSKLMDVVIGMDKMIGPDFEAGLAKLKAEAEK